MILFSRHVRSIVRLVTNLDPVTHLTASGNQKMARTKLRSSTKEPTHHFNAFRTGAYLGIAIPALISGIQQSDHPSLQMSHCR